MRQQWQWQKNNNNATEKRVHEANEREIPVLRSARKFYLVLSLSLCVSASSWNKIHCIFFISMRIFHMHTHWNVNTLICTGKYILEMCKWPKERKKIAFFFGYFSDFSVNFDVRWKKKWVKITFIHCACVSFIQVINALSSIHIINIFGIVTVSSSSLQQKLYFIMKWKRKESTVFSLIFFFFFNIWANIWLVHWRLRRKKYILNAFSMYALSICHSVRVSLILVLFNHFILFVSFLFDKDPWTKKLNNEIWSLFKEEEKKNKLRKKENVNN